MKIYNSENFTESEYYQILQNDYINCDDYTTYFYNNSLSIKVDNRNAVLYEIIRNEIFYFILEECPLSKKEIEKILMVFFDDDYKKFFTIAESKKTKYEINHGNIMSYFRVRYEFDLETINSYNNEK